MNRPSASVRVPGAPRGRAAARATPRPRRLGEQRQQHPREVERAGGQVVAHEALARRAVTGGVEQVDDRQRDVQARGQVLRDRVGDARRGDLLLRPCDPRGHRRLAHQERVRDVRRRTPHTSRRVSATCASHANAGWQQMKTSRRRSSGNASTGSCSPSSSGSLRWSVAWRCIAFNALRRATVVSHAPGLRGAPSCQAVSACT